MATNPFDVPAPKAKPSSNPFDSAPPPGLLSRAAGDVGWVMDKLSRPGYAGAALAAGRGGHAALDAFIHGESPQQYDADTETIMRNTEPVLQGTPLGVLPHGVRSFVTQMAVDPTTYLGGTGGLKEAAMRVTEGFLPAAVHAGARLPRAVERGAQLIQHIPRVGAHVDPHRAGEAVRGAQDAIAKTYDRITYGGELKRGLAGSQTPERGAQTFADLAAAKNKANASLDAMKAALHGRFNEIVEGLTPKQEHALYRAANSGNLKGLSKAMRGRVQQFSELTDSVAHLLGTKGLRKKLADQGFTLPDWAKPFDTGPRSLMRPSQYRQNYLPLAHDLDPKAAQTAERLAEMRDMAAGPKAVERKTLTGKDPFLKPRQEGLAHADNEFQRQTVVDRLTSAAKALAAKDAQRAAAQVFASRSFRGVPSEARRFIETEQEWKVPKWAELVEKAVDLPKQALFALPLRHMLNISALQALHYPSALPETIANYAKLMRDPSQRASLLADAIRAGSVGSQGPDRSRNFADFLDKFPMLARTGAGAAAGGTEGARDNGWQGGLEGAGLGALLGAKAPDIYRWSNKALWTYDDAAKAAATRVQAQRYLDKGLSKTEAYDRAAKDVGDRLINYGERSPLTKLLGFALPFATWRSKLPGSIARALVEHPERVLAASRATHGIATGGQLQTDKTDSEGRTLGLVSYNPLSDTLAGADNPAGYARSAISYPYQALIGAAELALAKAKHDKRPYPYMTYGKSPLRWLLQGALGPYADPLGASAFANQDNPLFDLLGGQTGIYLQRMRTP